MKLRVLIVTTIPTCQSKKQPRLEGQPNTSITLVVRRSYIAKPIPIRIIRKAMRTRSVTDQQVFYQSIGYLKLSDFSHTAAQELRDALIDINKRGISSLILDLRNNGGGKLNQAIKIARMFIHTGTILHINGTKTSKTISANNTAIFAVKPLILLINKSTASSAEVLASALLEKQKSDSRWPAYIWKVKRTTSIPVE